MKQLWLILAILEYKTLISNGSYCKTDRNDNHFYRIGPNIYIDNGLDSIWQYNTVQNKFLPYEYKLENIYGANSFDWVDTAYTYEFDRCDRSDKQYCDNLNKARNLTVVFGHLKQYKKYGYMLYRLSSNGDLIKITQPIGLWNLKPYGLLYSDKPNEKLVYQSSVFVKSRKQFYICIDTSSKDGIKYENMFFTLDNSSVWQKTVFRNINFRFRGMFYVNHKVFGVDSNNDVKQFLWINQNDITLRHISSEKEFFDCYGNSSLIHQKDRKNTVTANSGTNLSALHSEHSTELSVERTDKKLNDFGSGFWLYFVIIIAILIGALIVGLAVYFIFFRRKKSSETRTKSESEKLESKSPSLFTNVSINTIYSTTGQRVNKK